MKRLFLRFALALTAGFLFAPAVLADESEPADFITERPGATESTSIVPKDSVQIEIGWQRSKNDDDGVKTTTDELTQTLVRVGVHDNFEVRLGFAGYIGIDTSVTGSPTFEDHGAGDLSIGGKIALMEEWEHYPAVAFLAGFSLPTGEESSGRIDPSCRLLMGWTLHERISFGSNLGIAFESEEDLRGSRHTVSSFEYTFSLAGSVTDRVGVYAEYFGDAGLSRKGGPRNYVNSGVTFMAQDNIQLDFAVGGGVSEDADDWFVLFGISLRLPR